MPQNMNRLSFRPLTDDDWATIAPPMGRPRDERGRFITAAAPVVTPAETVEDTEPAEPVEEVSPWYFHGHCEECGESIERHEDTLDYRTDNEEPAYECDMCSNVLCRPCYRSTGGDCEDCRTPEPEEDDQDDDDYRSDAVRGWNWKPSVWRPKGEYPNAPLLGVELELHGDAREIVRAVHSVDATENHLYMKEDGSISGVEIVAHPGTLAWEIENRVWENALVALAPVASAHPGYGLHIHVSRNAFRHNGERSRLHDMVWLKFMYANAEALKVLSRRDWRDYEDGRWCKFARPDAATMRQMTRWSGDMYRWDRYLAVNCNNERTYELRFFRATMDYSQLLAAMQLATASVEYTRGLRAADVIAGALDWHRFMAWVAERPEYEELWHESEGMAAAITEAIAAGAEAERVRLQDGRANMDYRWQQLANTRVRREQERAEQERFQAERVERMNRMREELRANRAAVAVDDDDPISWNDSAELTPAERAVRDGRTVVQNNRLFSDEWAVAFDQDVPGVMARCICSDCDRARDQFARTSGQTRVYYMSQRDY